MSQSTALPLVIESDGGESLAERVKEQRGELRAALLEHGALLLRGFPVRDVTAFDAVVRGLSGDPLTYTERSSPRHAIQGQVYTSTDYPPNEEIFLHNENSYQQAWPMALYFYCVQPPLSLGATSLAGTREVLAGLDPAVRDEFTRRDWRVVRNFHPGIGLSWQHVFDTEDRAAVEAYCAANDIEAMWLPGGGLRTTAVRKAVHTHPVSGERVWFNHAAFFHVTTLDEVIRDGLLEMFEEPDLPTNTYFGDGGRIPDDVIAHVRDCYRAATTRFDYRRHDVLVIDNMLTSHGREPFTGSREIAVAMAEPFRP
ncbi:TauD/TfdA family dioxygenase [Streptomyces sp. Li-HN-5-11]|uniref:TauD/TfdA family dioxygenase n=1 Tax=Streptomyces sp. Li-HN-5-11 TaxID=3075432 RepID=UPI0028AAC2C6|nr:TauD/TfdA family dioxygenase [Streptomyces sp. Li-HN-5-11]WNM31431.1 TauD/TfdA family dioxygenase [Streptomyces sp. Li-HN-5-11]